MIPTSAPTDRPDPPIPPLSRFELPEEAEADELLLLTREAGLLDTSAGRDTTCVTLVTVATGVEEVVLLLLELGATDVVVVRDEVVLVELDEATTAELLDDVITTGAAVVVVDGVTTGAVVVGTTAEVVVTTADVVVTRDGVVVVTSALVELTTGTAAILDVVGEPGRTGVTTDAMGKSCLGTPRDGPGRRGQQGSKERA